MSEFLDTYNDVSEMLEKNTLELIQRICQEIDNIEHSFDILDNKYMMEKLKWKNMNIIYFPNYGLKQVVKNAKVRGIRFYVM